MRALAIRSQNSLFVFNPGGCGQAEQKKGRGEKTAGLMGGWCSWLHGGGLGETFRPPILYLSKPGEALAAAELQPLARCLSVPAILRQHLLSYACHSRNACARRRSIIKLESLSSWQLNQQRDGSLMDRRLPGQQRAGSRSGYGHQKLTLTSHQPLMLVIIAHFVWTRWWERCDGGMMLKRTTFFERHAVLSIETRDMWGDGSFTQCGGH